MWKAAGMSGREHSNGHWPLEPLLTRALKTELKFGCFVLSFLAVAAMAGAQTGVNLAGVVVDPAGLPLAGAQVEFDRSPETHFATTTDSDGKFRLLLPAPGVYAARVQAPGFAALSREFTLTESSANLTLRLERLAAANLEVIVSANVGSISLDEPDP